MVKLSRSVGAPESRHSICPMCEFRYLTRLNSSCAIFPVLYTRCLLGYGIRDFRCLTVKNRNDIIQFRTLILSTLTLLGCTLIPISGQDILINEFLASNVTDFPEMYDFSDYSDWIELYNSGDTSLTLDEYFLSDNENEPLKWKIPPFTTLAAGEYLIIWADGYDEGPGSYYQRSTWPYADYTTRHYHTNFKLSKSGEELLLARADIQNSVELISSESFWKYLDDGSDQGSAWKESDFDDSVWNEGAAELGYGDGDETTVLNYGPDDGNKYITTYFRKSFSIDTPDDLQQLHIRLKRDDGGLVYLNGNELFRSNMPVGPISYETEASSAVSSTDEDTFFEFSIPASNLLPGENMLAVEIHQISGSSSDISFDLELLGLGYSNIQIMDSIIYGPQVTDVSYGRTLAGTDWTFFGEPTIGSVNTTSGVQTPVLSSIVESTLESGFYPGVQVVDLTTSNSEAQIYYTLDGSRPGSASTPYTLPISISETSVLKARALEPGKIPGETLTLSFFINEDVSLPTISLVAEPPTLWDSDIGIYENEYKQREIPVQVEYFKPDQSQGFSVRAGARLGGMNIWTKPQKPFTIYTRDRFGVDHIPYQIFQEKPITDFSRIVFRNGGDDWEETLLRDPMTGSLVQGRMKCGYMAYQPASLFLNGDYWGIYNIREKYNKRYFFENFGVDPDNIDHLEYGGTAVGTRLMAIEGDLQAYNSLISFILNNNLDEPALYSDLQQKINIDGFIDHVTMTLYCANTSWGHNREWWRAREADARWEWLIVDVDRGFNPSNINNNLLDNLLGGYLLFQYLIESERFEDRFLQRAAAHFNNTFDPDRISDIVDSLAYNIQSEMPRHIDRWGSLGSVSSMSEWEDELHAIKTFAQARSGNLYTHFNNELGLDGTIQINTATYPSEGGNILINEVPQISENVTGTYFRNRPVILTAIPAPGWEVIGWSGLSDSSSINYNCEVDTSFIALFQPSSGTILPHVLTSNTALLANHRYFVSENLHVPVGVTLSIEPGVELLMPAGGHIIVDGKMMILGTAEARVNISANHSAGAERWGGISFSNEDEFSVMAYVNVSGASKGVDPIIHRGAISAINTNLMIDHMDIRDVVFPVYVEGGSTQIHNSSFRCDYTSDFINVKRGGVTIDSCSFYGNDAPDTDAIDLDGVSNGIVSHNRIYNFSGDNSDGIDIGEACDGVLIHSNLIYHASDKGISIGQGSSITIRNNLIVGCVSGVAVKDYSFAQIDNNTFVNNQVAVACFEKNAGNGGGNASAINNIMAGSRIASASADSLSEISVSYSLSTTELIPGTGNLYADPIFLDPSNYNFELSPESPAIDAGDPDYPQDADTSPIDMGAGYIFHVDHYPFVIPGASVSHLKINELLASNSSISSDEAGEYDDWLEIFNPTEQPIDMAGCFLTDEPDNLAKWEFPTGSSIIAPGAFLIVWCDQDVNQGELHTDFKLSAEGEFLALVGTNGTTIIDSLTTGPQVTDVSYGRRTDGGPEWVSMIPSPGSSNSMLSNRSSLPLPSHFALHQNYPNPFNPSTLIRYELPQQAAVEIVIYDLRGRQIRTLFQGSETAGYRDVTWDGTNEFGHEVSAGIYLVVLRADAFVETKKLVLLH